MSDEASLDPAAALTELRNRLRTASDRRRLKQKHLVACTGLSRTTISRALSSAAPAPTSATVHHLADALRSTSAERQTLLDLLNTAAGTATAADVGQPIGEHDPYDRGVHPAIDSPDLQMPRGRAAPLTTYVSRAHDEDLAAAVDKVQVGGNQMLVLAGASSTGKTRACWEAIQPLAEAGWSLWEPFTDGEPARFIEQLGRVRPCTVIWLDEAQLWLGTSGTGEQVAAALHAVLSDSRRAPVLVLGTLWNEDAESYLAPRSPGERDVHLRVRKLLEGRVVSVSPTFSGKEARAATETSDARMHQAVMRTENDTSDSTGELPVAQFLAGAPELVRRHQQASPAVRAVLDVAMDVFRLPREPWSRLGLPARELPVKLLAVGAWDYFLGHDLNQLPEDWLEGALADAGRPVHGDMAPLSRFKPRSGLANGARDENSAYRLANYLEFRSIKNRARRCPPESFWQAVYDHLPPHQLGALGEAAYVRHRLRWADRLWRKAATGGSVKFLTRLAHLRVMVEDFSGAAGILQQAAEAGSVEAASLLEGLHMGRRHFDRRFLVDHSHPGFDPDEGPIFEFWGNFDVQEFLPQVASFLQIEAETSHPEQLVRLATVREYLRDHQGAEVVARKAADAGYAIAIREIEWIRESESSLSRGPRRSTDADGISHRVWRYGLEADGTPSTPW